MENKLQQLYTRLCSCAVFRGVLEHPIFTFFGEYCCAAEDALKKRNAYGAFVSEIYKNGGDLTDDTNKDTGNDTGDDTKNGAPAEVKRITSDTGVSSAIGCVMTNFALSAVSPPYLIS